ncbi:hypothetical protein OH76DRAFT_1411907 [Lentinus brumalis]|uniref:Uncharacterized protein n=1 Tax=Lentinus brumalis TaxID=2498619 RepID=A0A371CMV5_9APHY|nr:hypothetical protein OH76DRAFT_1411907 [Polyporus brumalis]
MSDTFITELVESLSHIVRDNASVVSDQRVDTRPLKTSQPQYHVRLVSSLQNLLDAHIGLKSNTKVHEKSHHVTEGALETLKQENRRLAESTAQYKSALAAADKEKAQVKAQYDLQVRQTQVTKDALNAVQQENQRLAESAAQYKSALIAAEQEKAKAEADHNIQVKQARDTQVALTALQEENRCLAESTVQYKSALAAAEQDKARARAEHANLQVRQARATEGALNAFEHENRRLVESTAQYKIALAAAEHEKAKAKAEHDLQLQAQGEQLRLRMEQYRVAEAGRDRVTTENKKLVKTLEAYREHNRTKTLQAEELTSEVLRLKQSLNVVNVEYSKALALLVKAGWLDRRTLQQNRNNVCVVFGRTTVSTGDTEAESYVRVPALCSEGLRNTTRGSRK